MTAERFTMAGLGDLLQQMGHYSIASIGVVLAGLVSYPILTRVLKVSEYGIMGIVVTLLNVSVGLSKLGFQFSIVRFWPAHSKQEGGRERFVFTLFLAMISIGAVVLLLYEGCTLLFSSLIGRSLTFFIVLAGPLVLIRAMSSFGLSLLRAREWSGTCAAFEVLTTYAAMILAVVGATTIIGGLTGYYVGLTAGEILVAIALMIFVLRGIRFRRSNLHPPLIREVIAFGLPMALYELSGVFFAMADRFVIISLLDETALGYYAVAFNLARYIDLLFSESVERAAVPIYTNLYETEGPEATGVFLKKASRLYFLFVLPAIGGMTIIREDLLVLLASEKFLPGASLVHILLAGFLCYGTTTILGAGLFLKKQPWKMAGLNFGAAAFNVVLNLVLIPLLALRGAAIATMITQFTLMVLFWILGSRQVSPRLDLVALLKHVVCAAIMTIGIYFVDTGPGVPRLVLRLIGGIVVYGGLLLIVDSEVRELASRIVAKARGGQG